MDLRAQRLLVLFGLCTVFGAAVWMLDSGSTNSRSLLAAVPATEPSKTEDKCVAECTKENGEKFECGKSVTINQKGEQESSKPNPDVKAGTCRTTYTDQDGKKQTIDENSKGYLLDKNGELIQFASNGGQPLPASSLLDSSNLSPAQQQELAIKALAAAQGGSSPAAGAALSTALGGAKLQEVSSVLGPSTAQSGASAEVPSAPSAAKGIGDIAAGGGAPSPSPGSGSAPSGSSNAGSTFSPSSGLTGGSPFSLGSLFGGGSPSAGGGGSGGGYSGGTFAYAPASSPVTYPRGYEAVDSQVTFAQPSVTPGDLIARLAQNTQRSITRVTADDLSGGSVVSGIGSALSAFGESIVTSVGDFFSNTFGLSPEGQEIASIAGEQGNATPGENPIAEDNLLKLAVADLTLLPGDPRIFAGIEEIAEGEAEPSNPFFSGVTARTDPWKPILVGDLLSGLFGYGSGGGSGDGEYADAASPEEYPSGEDIGGGSRDAIQGAIDDSRPKSAFAAMRLSLGAIGEALANLFKNFFNSLFWWV